MIGTPLVLEVWFGQPRRHPLRYGWNEGTHPPVAVRACRLKASHGHLQLRQALGAEDGPPVEDGAVGHAACTYAVAVRNWQPVVPKHKSPRLRAGTVSAS